MNTTVGQPTPQQLAVLDEIRRYQAEHRRAPTFREIAQALGYKSATSARQFAADLARKGLVEWDDKIARSLRLTDKAAA